MLRPVMITAFVMLAAVAPRAQQSQPFEPGPTIFLGEVRGRIDHMAIDVARRRLFVAELGNDSVGIVDLKERKVIQRISGLSEPQGVGYVPSTDALYVANGGDGTLRIYTGATYTEAARWKLGSDADNVRVDPDANRVIVGHGGGALAIIDAASRDKIPDIQLKGHPEGFQLSRTQGQIYINIPSAHEIAVVDLKTGRQTAAWAMRLGGNFPMALDEEHGRVLSVFRNPTRIGIFAMQDGRQVAEAETCGDADDIFLDAMRHRAYVSCGTGAIDVVDTQDSTYRRVARILTAAGARTALFSDELDQLFLAVPARRGQSASIRIHRPAP